MREQLSRYCLEQLIAGGVPVSIVDGLEAIEVYEHESGLGAVTFHMRERAFELALEAAPIQNVEERIDIGAGLKLADAGPCDSKLALEALVFRRQRGDRR